MGFGFATVTPSATSVAQVGAAAVWTYPQRSLTDIQSLVNAIQSNNPGAVPSYTDLQYVPVPYYAGQVTADQAAAFIDNAIRNYNLLNPFVGFINNNPYNLWPPNAVGAFLSSQNMSQTSVALLLANVGTTQMAQALSSLSGNYTNVAAAFNVVSPATGATVMANMSASQAAFLLSYPVMSVTQAAQVLANSNMSITQAAQILSNSNMPVTQAASIVSIAVNYNVTQVAQELNLLSTSELINIAMNPNMSLTSLAAILSNAGLSANNAQLVLYYMAQNYYYNRWANTITGNAGSTTISTNVTVVNPLYSQNLTIASGVTVTCGTHTCFFVAQSFNNYGTIVNPYGAPGGTAPTIAGAGGTGGGGIVVISITAVLGTLNVNGGNGITAVGYRSATGTGGYGMAGAFYVTTGVAVPSGGSGIVSGQNGGPNGGGGGEGYLYNGAPGGGSTDYSFSNPNAMITYILQGIGDWWLANVVGKVPSTTTQLAFMYGSGGGGGSEASGYASGGGGGGGGGEVVTYGYNILSGTINAAGGAGGTGMAASGYAAGGGGGGGGGLVFIFYGATSGTVTADLAGGAGGAGSTSSANGLPGSTGVLYVTTVTVNG